MQAVGDGGSENEPSALDTDHHVDGAVRERRHNGVNRLTEADGILQERCDVVEKNPRLREVGNVTDLALQLVHTVEDYISRPIAAAVSRAAVVGYF